MPAYHFRAVTGAGKEQKGVIEAESEKHARQLLRDKTLIPLHIRPTQAKSGLNQNKDFFNVLKNFTFKKQKGLTSKDLALITRQFATLLSAGLPIEETLVAVAEQSDKPHIKGLILSVRGKVVEGHSLAASMREFPQAFSALFCATIAAGEKSGHLDKVLVRLADYTEQQWQMQQKLKTALIYPSMIILVAVGIVGFLLEYVVPKMIAVYGRLNQALPTLTEILIFISQAIKDYGLYSLLIAFISFYSFRQTMKKNETFRDKIHHIILRLPLFGYAIKTADTARFSRTLSILSGAGVPILEAMNISSQLITIIPIKKAVAQAVAHVREGVNIHIALKQTGYFSAMSIHMIASGQATGQLENMLHRVALNQEDDVSRLIEVSLALFEPAVILIMGIVVLFIVLAVLLPIFQLNEFTG